MTSFIFIEYKKIIYSFGILIHFSYIRSKFFDQNLVPLFVFWIYLYNNNYGIRVVSGCLSG